MLPIFSVKTFSPPVWERAVHMVYRSVFRGHLSSFVRVLSLLVLRGGMIDLIVIIPEHFLSLYIRLEKMYRKERIAVL